MIFRRVRRSEQGELTALCKSDTRWARYFAGHSVWLDRALRDVAAADRVVLGAFETRQGESDSGVNKLVACLFLKLSSFEHSIEIKNLILPLDPLRNSDADLTPEAATTASQLVRRAILFCESRGVPRIEAELPQDEHGIIAAFLGEGFRIVSMRERYGAGKLVCTLERTMGDVYSGDPFDVVSIARWFLRMLAPSEVVKTEIAAELVKISFLIRSSSPRFLKVGVHGSDKRLRGTAWILQEDDPEDESVKTILADLRASKGVAIALAEKISPEGNQTLTDAGVLVISRDEMVELAGGQKSTLSIPISQSDIGGVVTVLERDSILRYASQHSLTYFLLSGLHAGLDLPDEDLGMVLAVYCPNWEKGAAGIVGICIIKEIRRRSLKDILESGLPEDSALSPEDLGFYRTYSDEQRVAQLTCGSLVLFREPLPLGGSWIENLDYKKYLHREIVAKTCNSAYLNNACAEALLAKVDTDSKNENIGVEGTGDQEKGFALSRIRRKTMKVLFLSANSLSTPRLDIESEVKALEQELAGVKFRRQIRLISKHAVGIDDLVRYVGSERPTVLHFSGHGTTQGIMLREASNTPVNVTGGALRRFLENRGVELVVLNSCYSITQAEEIKHSVSAVIGTTNVIKDQAATKFSVAFYRSLGEGRTIAEAFRDGRDVGDLQGFPDAFAHLGDLNRKLVG